MVVKKIRSHAGCDAGRRNGDSDSSVGFFQGGGRGGGSGREWKYRDLFSLKLLVDIACRLHPVAMCVCVCVCVCMCVCICVCACVSVVLCE